MVGVRATALLFPNALKRRVQYSSSIRPDTTPCGHPASPDERNGRPDACHLQLPGTGATHARRFVCKSSKHVRVDGTSAAPERCASAWEH